MTGVETSMSAYKGRMLLRQYHKRLRAGLVQWEDVPSQYQELLRRYYGYNELGFQE